jgi:hypothetical protein
MYVVGPPISGNFNAEIEFCEFFPFSEVFFHYAQLSRDLKLGARDGKRVRPWSAEIGDSTSQNEVLQQPRQCIRVFIAYANSKRRTLKPNVVDCG